MITELDIKRVKRIASKEKELLLSKYDALNDEQKAQVKILAEPLQRMKSSFTQTNKAVTFYNEHLNFEKTSLKLNCSTAASFVKMKLQTILRERQTNS